MPRPFARPMPELSPISSLPSRLCSPGPSFWASFPKAQDRQGASCPRLIRQSELNEPDPGAFARGRDSNFSASMIPAMEEMTMPIEFTHVPGKTADAAIPFFYDFAETATKLGLIEDGGFQKIVVDDSAGLLTNMDLAAQVLDRTASLEVVLTHWAGVVEPTVAARQLASMDRKSGGRLALRMISEP